MDLIAQGTKSADRWQRRLPPDTPIIVGRACGIWSVPWDRWLSQEHIELRCTENKLLVRRLPTGRNPVYFHGRESDVFEIKPGEWFVAGKSVFTFHQAADATEADSPIILQTRTVSHQELERIPYRNAPQRLDVLNRLPRAIASAANESELFIHLGNILLAGIPQADAIAIVAVPTHAPVADALGSPVGEKGGSDPLVLYRESRLSKNALQPSRQLIKEASTIGQSVLYVWQSEGVANQQFTLAGDFDWAFCTPLPPPHPHPSPLGGDGHLPAGKEQVARGGPGTLHGQACQGWCIYVTGRFTVEAENTLLAGWDKNALSDDLKFTELVAAILSSLRQVRSLEHSQAILSSFLSPGTLSVLREADPAAALKPRQADVTVLFCDLRGFSRRVEQSADNLFAVLERVSEALDVMNHNILAHDGVVSDFQGDSAMAFWGWPLADKNKVQNACLAAVGIRNTFQRFACLKDHPLADFRAGIGIASGTVVAGTVGSKEQGKVSVFGPVVNLCSRLQDMTKTLRVPVLLDEATARALRDSTPRNLARCRRLALVKPFGLETPLVVSELLPPYRGENISSESELTDEHLAMYENALDHFLKGDWGTAYKLLHQVPPDDHGKDLLIGYILQHQHTPPPNWNGVIAIGSK